MADSICESAAERQRAWHSPSAAVAAIRNVIEKSATLTIGRLAVSSPVERWRQGRWLRSPPLPPPQVRVALVAHAFYPELVPELLRCHRWLPLGSPLHLTTTPQSYGAVCAATSGVPGVTIHIVPNRGRDIAPFLEVLDSGELDAFDAVLKLHTKRSMHLWDGDIRRRLFYLALAGGPARVHRILTLFEAASTGIVGWRPSYRRNRYFWQRNRKRGSELIARMGGSEDTPLGFFEGSMFWVRPAALRRLRRLNLDLEDFEIEAGQTDGTLHHAAERIFCVATALEGFDTLSTSGRLLRCGSRLEADVHAPLYVK